MVWIEAALNGPWGGHVRAGLDDVPWGGKASNPGRVEQAVRLARHAGHEPTTATSIRAALRATRGSVPAGTLSDEVG